MRLVKPCSQLQETFLDFVKDVKAAERDTYEHYVQGETDFEGYLSTYDDLSRGIGVEKGWAPTSSFWLIDEREEMIGAIRIRHHVNSTELEAAGHIGYEIRSDSQGRGYGKILLRLGLDQAKKMGLSEVLITCDADNGASKRLIESVGGVFLKELPDPDSGEPVLQYRVVY